MKYGINSYQDRIENPGLGIIDFSYVALHPECIYYIKEKYMMDTTFKRQIDEKMTMDPIFREKFSSILGEMDTDKKAKLI